MAKVTLEGSNTPSTFLKRGARVTVERTALIEKYIRKGYVTVVAAAAVPVEKEVAQIVEAQREAADNERQLTGAPARNASREDWAEFLRTQEIPFWQDDTRNTLIDRWDRRDAHAESEDAPEDEDDGGTED